LERMANQLAVAVDHLCQTFEINPAELSEVESVGIAAHREEFILDREPFQSRAVESANRLPPRSRSEIRRHSIPSWLDEVKAPYLTEPEKRLARSWEVEFLIPLFNAVSQKINLEYGDKIIQIYNSRDFFSRMARPLIEPPHYPAIIHGNPADHRPVLPARINLRPLASKYFIASLFFFWFFIWMFDYGLLRGIFWMLALPAFFLFTNALLEPFRDTHD